MINISEELMTDHVFLFFFLIFLLFSSLRITPLPDCNQILRFSLSLRTIWVVVGIITVALFLAIKPIARYEYSRFLGRSYAPNRGAIKLSVCLRVFYRYNSSFVRSSSSLNIYMFRSRLSARHLNTNKSIVEKLSASGAHDVIYIFKCFMIARVRTRYRKHKRFFQRYLRSF